MDVSESGYHSWATRKPSKRAVANAALGEVIKREFEKSRATYGKRRMCAKLNDSGNACGPERMAKLMKEKNLKVKTKRKFKSTTDSNHAKPVAPNLLQQNFTAPAPNRVWTSDISYIRTDEGWLYLCIVLDVFSRAIVGWSMSDRMTAGLVEDAITSAIKQRPGATETIFHSDKGSQYCSAKVTAQLASIGFTQSMSGKGNCYDNAVTETFFSTLKKELVYQCKFATRSEAKQAIFEYIEVFYNRIRIHSTLDYASPFEYEAHAA